MKTTAPMDEFQKRLWLSSVQLVRLNEQRMPTGIASGGLVDYMGKRLLLTVSHATGDQKNWAIQLKYVPSKGTSNYQLGAMCFLARGSIDHSDLKEVDFSYVEVPPSTTAFRQEIDEVSGKVKYEVPIDVHTPSFTDVPLKGEEYGFCGMVMPTIETHFGQTYFGGELRVYSGLTYLRSEGDYEVFSMPFQHPGHEHFKGCSGAPILNRSGAIVALVCKGFSTKNEIWGVSLRTYKTPIDILVGRFE